MKRDAIFSTDRRYRYRLTRWWREGQSLSFVMLNPSTANETSDDPTIRRCISFAKAWGYGGIYVVNLYSLVSTDPAKLLSEPDSIGMFNDAYVYSTAEDCSKLVVAWGNHGADNKQRVDAVLKILNRFKDVYCLGKNKNGQPRHPLYVRMMPESDTLLFFSRPTLKTLEIEARHA